jgi:hypothetical protein
MALTVSEIQAIISTLESRMSSAAGTERFQDQEVRWVTTEELISKINYFKDLLAETDGTSATTRVRFMRMYTSSGY